MTILHADSPITTKDEDRLHYHRFALALAKGIAERAPSDGFVIGVQAQWGMRKSSAINLALEAIEAIERTKPEKSKVKVQTFNPWRFSGLASYARRCVGTVLFGSRPLDRHAAKGTFS
jgi:predicted KAP-like P-loop ATPase